MKSSRLEKYKKRRQHNWRYKKSFYTKERNDTTIKDVRNCFRLKKEIEDTTVKDIRNLFRLKKENKSIKNGIIKDTRNLFEHEEENYYKLVRVGNFWNNSYVEHASSGDKNKILSVEEYLNKTRPYLKYIINNLEKCDMWKIQLKIAINLMSSKDNDEECITYSKGNNIEIMINYKANEVIDKLFQSLLNRYQIGLETSMRGSDFILIMFIYCLQMS